MKLSLQTILFLGIFILLLSACSGGGSPDSPDVSTPPSVENAVTLDFPRLGMWWPDPWEQSLDEIARYDYVILADYAAEFIAPLRARNPDILLLTATNACELGFNPDPAADPAENEEVLNIPPEWFLTQVGSQLAQDVDATTTIFYVNDLVVNDGAETYTLFEPGDTVLIEGESVYVEAVDNVLKTLTVRRGYVRPAASHQAGTRVAAHITFWPDSWLLNLSTMSPTAVFSPAIGSERWSDYNARVGAALVSNADWDGILTDRSDPNQSWLIGATTARTIDPDQSNTLLTDYSPFDVSWNEGLRRYEAALREMIGVDKIFFPNWGMANYDLLNGNNYEGFPLEDGSSYRSNWQGTVFGELADIGSYFEWMERGQHPNLTLIETYEDDGGPDPASDGRYDNPYDDPNFIPNYRKMRFGLTTALLNDGFFSYEINTNGHGTLGLLWFDEYDNSGQGRGYLGQPLGAAYRVSDIVLGSDLLVGGGFENVADLAVWDLWADGVEGYAATAFIDHGTAGVGAASAKVEIDQAQGIDWRVSFRFLPVEIVSGRDYTLSFWAKSDRARTMKIWVQQTTEPWETYLSQEVITLGDTWQSYSFSMPASGSDGAAELSFGLGGTLGTVWLDDVHLQNGSREVWRRDYEHGIVLVNATSSPQTISLDSTFKKIDGSQVPAINNGGLVSEVTLSPLDGLILLRVE